MPADSLARRIRADDALALARLVDLTYGRCLAVARTLHPDDSSAERAVLDGYLALWLSRQTIPASADDAALAAWLAAALVASAPGVRPAPTPRWRGWLRRAALVGPAARAAVRRLAALRATARVRPVEAPCR